MVLAVPEPLVAGLGLGWVRILRMSRGRGCAGWVAQLSGRASREMDSLPCPVHEWAVGGLWLIQTQH